MDTKYNIQFTLLAFSNSIALVAFGILWFQLGNIPQNFSGSLHAVDYLLFLGVTYVIWLPMFMKVLIWAIASHIQPPRAFVAPEKNKRVAFITTFVPGAESASLLHRILPTLVNARYPHDTWLLDEGDDAEAKAVCAQYGVKHFSRFGMDHYNSADGKFAVKTKGGNHNAWYAEHGDKYDYVAQIDTDFIVSPEFLVRTLGYFRDPTVAFVGTPQIYGNTHRSLIARGAAQQTFNFYGPLLRGMAGMDSMLLIGANHVIRVAALRSVDHYAGHITEDLLTGMKLHSAGWKSIYVPEPLSAGEGPTTWKAYFNQQNRWAYGCMHILFNHSFKLFNSMSIRRIGYYFSIQQYYFSGIAMLIGMAYLALYFLTGIQSISIDFTNFVVSYLAIVAVMGLMDLWLQRFNIRPHKESGIMWAGMYICISVWPVFMMAFLRLFRRKKLTFKVTPKGQAVKKQPSPLHLFIPHMVLGILTLGGFVSSFFSHRNSPIMLFWALVAGLLLLVVPIIPAVHRKFASNLPRS